MKRIVITALLAIAGLVLFFIGFNPDPDDTLDQSEGAATNPIVQSGGLWPSHTVAVDRAEGAPGVQAETGRMTSAADQNLAHRVRQALTNPGAGAGGTISTQVDPPLRGNAQVPTVRNLEVHVSNGVVTIQGHVATAADKDSVESMVRQVPGVAAVRAELTVDSGVR